MKKTNFASMLAVAGGLAISTAACTPPADEGDTAADEAAIAEQTAEGGEPNEQADDTATEDKAE